MGTNPDDGAATGFSSGLSVADFAACLAMDLEPVGLVQGFCAMQVGGLAMGLTQMGQPMGGQGGYVENYQCPHGMVGGEHRMWGQNYEQTWLEQSWSGGFTAALDRLREEATRLGAHGVVGVVDTETSLAGAGIIEFHLRGTAVRVAGTSPTNAPWTTYLAGQRLVKLFESGFAPVSVVAVVASVRVYAYCITEYLLGGGGLNMWSSSSSSVEIDQIVRAQSLSRDIARSMARAQLHGDDLQAARLDVVDREHERGDLEILSTLRGNRVRRFRAGEALAAPQPTVRLT
ncbi:MAG: heavy metal-binding domain-containing protein [Acidimicrobiales bacterium]